MSGLNAKATEFTPTYASGGGGGGGGGGRGRSYGGAGYGGGGYGGDHAGAGYGPEYGGGARGFHGHASHGHAQNSPPPPGAFAGPGYGHHHHHPPHGYGHPPGPGGLGHPGHSHMSPGGHHGHHHHPAAGYGQQGNFGPRPPNPAAFAAHNQAWNQSARVGGPHATPNVPNVRPVIAVMGAPCAGKKTVGLALAQKLNFACVRAPDFDDVERPDRYDHLEKEVSRRDASGFVVVGYGSDSDADLFYLFHVLRRDGVKLVSVIYLDMPYSSIEKRSLGPATTAQMSAHCTGYEACSRHLASQKGFYLIGVQVNGVDRPTKDIVDEIAANTRQSLVDARTTPGDMISMPAAEAFERWSLVTDPKKFKELCRFLDSVLDTDVQHNVFPLRSCGGALDYNKFVRHYHLLQNYHVDLLTDGSRGLIFKVDSDVYHLPEHCTCVYKLDEPNLDPFQNHHATGERELVFALEADFCTVKVDSGTAAHVLIRDVLYFQGKTMKRTPRKDRKQIIADHFKESSGHYVLPHLNFTIRELDQLVQVSKTISSIITGIRFEHPYAYRLRSSTDDYDTRLMYWVDGTAPTATLRLWHSVEKETCYRFKFMVVEDESGTEKLLEDIYRLSNPSKEPSKKRPVSDAYVDIGYDVVEEYQLNDGQLVECRFKRAPAPDLKGPAARSSKLEWYQAGSWEFVRRRRDVLFPSYESTVKESVTDDGWPQDLLVDACKEIPPPRPVAGSPTTAM